MPHTLLDLIVSNKQIKQTTYLKVTIGNNSNSSSSSSSNNNNNNKNIGARTIMNKEYVDDRGF